MKIAIAQLRVRLGQIDLNLKEMKRMIDEAVLKGADLIVFPEMAVSGYLLSDRYLQKGFMEEAALANETLRNFSKDIGIIWGNIDLDPHSKSNRDGRTQRTNTAFFAHKGKWVSKISGNSDGRYIKHCLPDYRFFDDSRYFKGGCDVALERKLNESDLIEPFVFTVHNHQFKIGLQICEDLWSQDYRIDPTSVLIQKGSNFIINISSSPWTLNKELSRTKRIQEHVLTQKNAMVPLLYVNCAGIQNNGKNVLLFDGGSTLYSNEGQVLSACNDGFLEELKLIDLDAKETFVPTPDKLYQGLIVGIKAFDQEVLGGKLPWIIGLSGGIDSSVNAALLVEALGTSRVKAYNMASRYNSQQTMNVARNLAHHLNIDFHEGSIETLVEATQKSLMDYGYPLQDSGLSFENMQARLRGHLLSSFASVEKGVICNNGNKVELALGYATLYGDTIGALSPLGDCTKLQIFELARLINKKAGKAIIDEALIPSEVDGKYHFELPPSAELKEKQVDPMKWGYHDWLVQYLTQYPSHSIDEWVDLYQSKAYLNLEVAHFMRAYELDHPVKFVEDLRWFMRAYQSGIFKRIQFPPIIAVSRGSFGYDYRESQMPYIETEQLRMKLEALLQLGESI